MKKSISKKLEASKRKTSRLWRHYRVVKKKIVSKKRLPLDLKRGLLSEQRDITRKNISVTWQDYRYWKFGAIHHSPYDNFSFIKRTYTINTRQDWYKSKEKYFDDFEVIESNLDSQLIDILNEPGVKGIVLIFRVKDDETDLIHYVSDYVTKMSYERLKLKGISMYENLTNKLNFSSSVHEFEMKGIYIRIIYEKARAIKK
jgi:hypothetical protein